MQKSVDYFAEQLIGIRVGGISAGLIDTIRVPYQGQKVPINQLSQSVPKNGQICITPYDTSLLGVFVNSLKEAGFNAYQFSKTSVVVSCPTPNQEQLDKIVSQIKRLAEETRIAIRNIRKKMRQKDKNVEKPLQVLTDQFIEKVDLLMNRKIQGVIS